MQLTANGLTLEVDDYPARGSVVPGAAPILLVMGLGMPRTAWPLPLIEQLTGAGYRVLRFDNRDIGDSSKLSRWGRPNVVMAGLKHLMGWPVKSAYSLDDMARDAIGLLDSLGLPRVHLVGVSMGGMIGQLLAADHSARIASFTCIMSTSGARHLPRPNAATRRALMSRPASQEPQAIVEHYVKLLKVIGSPGYPTPDELARERISTLLAPYYFPAGHRPATGGDHRERRSQQQAAADPMSGADHPWTGRPAGAGRRRTRSEEQDSASTTRSDRGHGPRHAGGLAAAIGRTDTGQCRQGHARLSGQRRGAGPTARLARASAVSGTSTSCSSCSVGG